MDGNSTETKYPKRNSGREDSFVDGLKFQDYCVDLFADKINFYIQQYSSKEKQRSVGESRQFVEIKLDDRHTDTDRLSIEIAEKGKGTNREWVKAGIYANPIQLFYIVGNYKIVYLFSTKFLRSLHRLKKYEEDIWPRDLPTIQKFYLPHSDADKYCIVKLTPKSILCLDN